MATFLWSRSSTQHGAVFGVAAGWLPRWADTVTRGDHCSRVRIAAVANVLALPPAQEGDRLSLDAERERSSFKSGEEQFCEIEPSSNHDAMCKLNVSSILWS